MGKMRVRVKTTNKSMTIIVDEGATTMIYEGVIIVLDENMKIMMDKERSGEVKVIGNFIF